MFGNKKKIKIGILTFHNCINYGAFLQAYALQQCLKRHGLQSIIINYKNIIFTLNEYKYFLWTRKPSVFIKNLLKIIMFKRAQQKLSRTRRYFSANSIKRERFDRVIIGSDSVWSYSNPLSVFDEAYFAGAINAGEIISYAASFGPDVAEKGFPSKIKELLIKFHHISVRDDNSLRFIRALLKINAERVLDPIFLYDFKKEIAQTSENGYVLLFAFGLNDQQLADIMSYAKRMNKKLISVGYDNKGCDRNVVALGPFEWLGYVKNAALVITSMYHGLLFSIKYNKEFIVINTPERENKIGDIINHFGLKSRMIVSTDQIHKMGESRINWEEVNNKIEEEVHQSEKFLLGALQ